MFNYDINQPANMRMAYLDRNHPVGKKVSALCRRAATAKWKGENEQKHRDNLLKYLTGMDMGDLNHLACMYMIDRRFSGATGQGAIWAMASDICNEVARESLKDRPMFEAVSVTVV